VAPSPHPAGNLRRIDQFAYVMTIGTNISGPAVVNINATNSCDIIAPTT
jgi:hypothetical protein